MTAAELRGHVEERHIVPDPPMEDYNDYCARLAPPRFQSPYEPAWNCEHAVLIERTPDFTQPSYHPHKPLGGFVMLARDWQCEACGSMVAPHSDRSELRFKDGKVRAAYVPVPRVRKTKSVRGDERGRVG